MSKRLVNPVPLIWTLPSPPARQRSLGRDEIVAAATRLADAAGSGALTMAAVAGRLGSYSAMALYRYVLSKDGLIDLMLDHAVGRGRASERAQPVLAGRPATPSRSRTWEMVMRHGWYAQLVYTRPPLGPEHDASHRGHCSRS